MKFKFLTISASLALGMVSFTALGQLYLDPASRSPDSRATPQANSQGSAEPLLNRLVVKFKDQPATRGKELSVSDRTSEQRLLELGAAHAMQTREGVNIALNFLKTTASQAQVALTSEAMDRTTMNALVQRLAQDPSVEYAEIDERAYPQMTPTDPLFATDQSSMKPGGAGNLGGANFSAAWDRTASGVALNGAGVVVAVLDGGYRSHADLGSNVLPGYDFVSQDNIGVYTTANDGNSRDNDALDPGNWNSTASVGCPIADSSWHGTHVAGTIAALGNNGLGVIGAAYGAKILPVRVLGVCGGYVSDIADGIRWAAGLAVAGVPNNTTPARVINLSLGGTGVCGTTYQSAITAARNAGTVVLAATGNGSSYDTLYAPANCSGVIAVTAHTGSGASSLTANIGLGTTISAPGTIIQSTSNTGTTTPLADTYATKSGTSMAVPHVAGVVALIMQAVPGITPDQVSIALTSSARAFPAGTYCVGKYNTVNSCGAGLLDADAAVNAALYPATSSSGGGGGGGGSFGWLELGGLVTLLAAAWGLRRHTSQGQGSR
ncbi:S8 family peptidase [Rhodoferax sp. TS-BS-61-7]|uniref:S8 family peptidase n=1 Tax=Rhodoferax sp. TS-BS-61-7 TaxID=2094194 RepID=UPI000CF69913|nr:S8 family peptidase [Rhodoferax sp. TS-BS-61-7]PQA79023.1 peptidase S8 [Rhodoferax sp. TS-BS-61-7]